MKALFLIGAAMLAYFIGKQFFNPYGVHLGAEHAIGVLLLAGVGVIAFKDDQPSNPPVQPEPKDVTETNFGNMAAHPPAQSAISQPSVAALIEAANSASVAGYVSGTSNWAVAMRAALATSPVGINGLTEAETSQTASVMGLIGAQGDLDPLYDHAVNIVRKHDRGSISLVQRHLKISYNRAACMLEAMEKAGIITPWGPNGTGRDVVPVVERKMSDDTEGGEL